MKTSRSYICRTCSGDRNWFPSTPRFRKEQLHVHTAAPPLIVCVEKGPWLKFASTFPPPVPVHVLLPVDITFGCSHQPVIKSGTCSNLPPSPTAIDSALALGVNLGPRPWYRRPRAAGAVSWSPTTPPIRIDSCAGVAGAGAGRALLIPRRSPRPRRLPPRLRRSPETFQAILTISPNFFSFRTISLRCLRSRARVPAPRHSIPRSAGAHRRHGRRTAAADARPAVAAGAR